MLVLTRKESEAVWIVVPGHGPIRVSVERVGTLRVMVGIDAPEEVGIGRTVEQAARESRPPPEGRNGDSV